MRKGLWSPDEDEKLRCCIAKYTSGSWSDIARRAGLQRCGKSCRRRWMNHLRSDLKHGRFTPDEIRLVIELQQALGNRWSEIATHLAGRTDNDVKNLWNTQIKRQLRSKQAESLSNWKSSVDQNNMFLKDEDDLRATAAAAASFPFAIQSFDHALVEGHYSSNSNGILLIPEKQRLYSACEARDYNPSVSNITPGYSMNSTASSTACIDPMLALEPKPMSDSCLGSKKMRFQPNLVERSRESSPHPLRNHNLPSMRSYVMQQQAETDEGTDRSARVLQVGVDPVVYNDTVNSVSECAAGATWDQKECQTSCSECSMSEDNSCSILENEWANIVEVHENAVYLLEQEGALVSMDWPFEVWCNSLEGIDMQ